MTDTPTDPLGRRPEQHCGTAVGTETTHGTGTTTMHTGRQRIGSLEYVAVRALCACHTCYGGRIPSRLVFHHSGKATLSLWEGKLYGAAFFSFCFFPILLQAFPISLSHCLTAAVLLFNPISLSTHTHTPPPTHTPTTKPKPPPRLDSPIIYSFALRATAQCPARGGGPSPAALSTFRQTNPPRVLNLCSRSSVS